MSEKFIVSSQQLVTNLLYNCKQVLIQAATCCYGNTNRDLFSLGHYTGALNLGSKNSVTITLKYVLDRSNASCRSRSIDCLAVIPTTPSVCRKP